ncbi:3-phosphoserine/phosphohydroxythreonine transaminase [Marinicella meishanensis]|uniref:3-phosphoserine/phosphohydroxythreonine transaminase n=1 Tax=Marinicella meishanensis TaxID=2873263 RepID=UPI001CBFE4DA|nr:3-phosphoserine/phosphohydroxythreonine transaminase [Marinicella sp. NBU2979]
MTTYNFSAGPAVLPLSVKQQIEADLYDWRGTGCSVMEVSHRSQEFIDMATDNEHLLRELLNISDEYAVMLIPGGARMQYAMLPINCSTSNGHAIYAINGHWGKLAMQEAGRFTQVTTTAPVSQEAYTHIPAFDATAVNPQADYFHYTSNETLEGVQWHQVPDSQGVPLCCDMTSDLLTREFALDPFAMIYASAQKNMGIAGITLVIMRHEMIGRSDNLIPVMTDYATYARTHSFYNTPPTFPWYVMRLVLQWVKQQGGVAAMQALNHQKSALLYEFIDSSGFYLNKVDPSCRSEVNVPFWLHDEALNQRFLEASSAAGLKALKGHKAVGGMRASIYNAMPMAGLEALVSFMQEFERTHG